MIAESHAIMRYLADSRGCDDHWYPKDLRKRAKVNQYLDEHHNYIRMGVGVHIFKRFFAPMINGKSYSDRELEDNWW